MIDVVRPVCRILKVGGKARQVDGLGNRFLVDIVNREAVYAMLATVFSSRVKANGRTRRETQILTGSFFSTSSTVTPVRIEPA